MKLIPTILAALSAALCVTFLFFWVRSFSYYEGVARWSDAVTKISGQVNGVTTEEDINGRTTGLISYRGKITYSRIVNPTPEPDVQTWTQKMSGETRPQPGVGSLLFPTIGSTSVSMGSDVAEVRVKQIALRLPYWRMTLPYWAFVLLTAILPWMWFSRFMLLNKRARDERCLNCGHELKGLTGQCPVCKSEIPKE